MSVHATPARYSSAAIILHWLLAALLIFQVSLGWRLEELAGLPQFAAYQLHKTIGITILVLSIARLAIRIFVPRPRPVNTSMLLAALAGGVHALFYVVLIVGPITGWIIVSTSSIRVPTLLFGAIPWPHLPLGDGWHDPAEAIHALLGWLTAGLVFLHVAGALRHHILRKDLIGRMVPASLSTRSALNGVAAAAVVGAATAFVFAWLLPFGSGAGSAAKPATEETELANNAGVDELASLNEAINEAADPAVANEAAVADEGKSDELTEKAGPWQVQSGGTLGFRTSYSGSAVEGGFSRWDADISFSPDDLAGSSITVNVDLASVDSADSQRDETLKGDEFFGIASHPRATFRSTRITHRSGNNYRAAGTLSLHGKQNPATLNFTLDINGKDARVRGSTAINRSAFGVGTGSWADTDVIPESVAVNFNFSAKRTD